MTEKSAPPFADIAENDDTPEWAKILESGPIPVDATVTADQLKSIIAPRLAALLRLYGVKPDLEGWRDLAMMLATAHVPCLSPKIRLTRAPSQVGRPVEKARLQLGAELLLKKKRTGRTKGSIIEEYRDLEKKRRRKAPSRKSLYTAMSDAEKHYPGNLVEVSLMTKFNEAARMTAVAVEDAPLNSR